MVINKVLIKRMFISKRKKSMTVDIADLANKKFQS